MPGSIKNGGIWRSATGLYIKVGGTWRTVTSAYVKVGGQWKQWFASKIQDAFNRTSTAAGLGTADSGQAWNATSGNWRINGSNQAQSDDSASNYPIVSANLGNTDVKVQADVSGGVGPAFWVSSAGSWWAAVPRYTTVTTNSTSIVCDQNLASCNGSGCSPSGSCCSGVSESSSSNCNGGYVQCSNSSCSDYPNRCAGPFSSTSGGGQTCNAGCSSNQSGCPAGSCSCSSSTSGGTQSCTGGKTDVFQGSNCSSLGGNCGSGPFTETVNSSYCGGNACYGSDFMTALTAPGCGLPVDNGSYQCSGGQVYGSFNGQPFGCYTYSSGGTQYQVNDGGTCSTLGSGWSQVGCSNCAGMGPCGTGGFVCCSKSGTAGYTYVGPGTYVTNYCKGTGEVPFSYTNYYCYTALVGSPSVTTYNYCTGYTQNPVVTTYYAYTSSTTTITRSCYTGTRTISNPITNYKTELVLLSSVSGSVVSSASSTISDNTSGFTTVGSVYVQTGGNAISAYAYSSANLGGSQLGATLTHTASNPTKGTSVGIIKTPSTGSQGSTADNFLATIQEHK